MFRVFVYMLVGLLLAPVLAVTSRGDELYPMAGTYRASDTLAIDAPDNLDEREALEGFTWEAAEFDVTLDRMPDIVHGKPTIPACLSVSFPSPKPVGEATVDRVVCELYAAHDEQRAILKRPAVIIVHESGSGMHVGRLIAMEAGRRGLHALMVQLPGYGSRRPMVERWSDEDIVSVFKQGVCDVRRARDAAAALPFVDASHIALQGTSLGGFVATLAGSLDGRYDQVYLLLCGGELHKVLTQGNRDAAKTLERIKSMGIAAESLESFLSPVEPLRIAHRLDPKRTFLYSATFDTVVPPFSAASLSEAIGLDRRHHQEFWATHYSGIIYLPGVIHQMHKHAMQR